MLRRARATSEYTAQYADQLDLRPGQLVEIDETQGQPGFVFATTPSNGQQGFVPSDRNLLAYERYKGVMMAAC